MISDFVFSADGAVFLRDFKDKFGCVFRIDEPSGSDVIMDTASHSYRIPDSDRLEDFKASVDLSVKSGKNHVVKRYINNRIEYDDDTLY